MTSSARGAVCRRDKGDSKLSAHDVTCHGKTAEMHVALVLCMTFIMQHHTTPHTHTHTHTHTDLRKHRKWATEYSYLSAFLLLTEIFEVKGLQKIQGQ
jgi:hypothetical protein